MYFACGRFMLSRVLQEHYVAKNSLVQSFHYFRQCKPGRKHWTDRSLFAFTGMFTALQFAKPVLGLRVYRMAHEILTHFGFCTKCVLYTKVLSHILKSPTPSQRKTVLDSVSLSRPNSSEILRHCWLLMPHFSYWTRFSWVHCGLPGAPQRYLYYIKLFLSTPWKHKGGWIYSSTHS
jgi:hypothetical protein